MENIGIKSELVGPVWVGGLNGEGIINMKMVGLDYMFECGPTAREVLTVITAHVCGDCLVNVMCNVVCSNYLDTYRKMVEWLNDNEHREVNGLEILYRIEGLIEQARILI